MLILETFFHLLYTQDQKAEFYTSSAYTYSLYDPAILIRLDIPLSHYSSTCNNRFISAILYPPTLSPAEGSFQLPVLRT
jgi:hypothetical protein